MSKTLPIIVLVQIFNFLLQNWTLALYGRRIGTLKYLLRLPIQSLYIVPERGYLRLENVMLLYQIFSGQQMTTDIFGPEVFL